MSANALASAAPAGGGKEAFTKENIRAHIETLDRKLKEACLHHQVSSAYDVDDVAHAQLVAQAAANLEASLFIHT